MILATRHTGLVVRNLENSLVFYCDIFGLKVWKRAIETGDFIDQVVGIKNVRLEWAKLKAPDDSIVELLQYHFPLNTAPKKLALSNQLGCSHIAFTVKNLDTVYNTLMEKSIHCNSSPQHSPDGMAKVLYCHDPDGIIIELVEELS